MTKLYPATCKFCRLPLEVEIDDDYLLLRSGGDTVLPEIPVLTKLAACNRCADYENAKSRIRDRMAKVTHTLTIENYARRGTSPAAVAARETMRVLFSKWFDTVCGYYLIETQTDEGFVTMILERPEKWLNAFWNYERGCKGIAEDLRNKPSTLPYADA